MPSRSTRQPPSRPTLLRGVGFGIAVALGAVGIWLVVMGGSTQRVEIGVLTGLWGLLLGAICGRRPVADPYAPPSRFSATPTGEHPVGSDTPAGGEVAVRETASVDRLADAEARRAFEAQLEQLLRREIGALSTALDTAVDTAVNGAVEDAVSREIGALRAEIAHLRNELVDKVGGQLRLERIETTRLIGSDLEAMRDEVRRLQLARDPAAFELDARLARSVAGEVPEMLERAGAEPPQQAAPEPSAPAAAPRPAPPSNGARATTTETTRIPRVTAEQPPPAPAQAAPAQAAPSPAPQPAPQAAQPQPAPSRPADDPFASLPRLTPFTEFPLDPIDEPAAAAADAVDYAGRRRRAGEEPAAEADGPAGPSASTTQPAEAPPAEAQPSEAAGPQRAGRRHRRAEDGDGDERADLLARLLAREGVRR